MKERKSVLGRVGATLAGLLLAGAATAEDTPSGADGDATVVEEIVVTANKRSQSIQDVAGSLSALGAEDLDAKGIKDMYDIQFAVPSLHFGQFLGTGSLAIRGIGEFARQPGVAVSLDGIYQSRSNTAQLYQLDLERVEVLRGPQGTLYGRNSNGGAVNFISAAPTREVEGMLRVGYAEYDETKIQAVYSGPIGDRVALRISADRIDRGEGWVENRVPGAEDQMQGEYGNVRLKLAAELSDTVSADLMYAKGTMEGPLDHISWITSEPERAADPKFATAAHTTEPHEVFVDTKSDSDRDFELYGLTVEWDMGWATLRSVTAQQEFYDFFRSDRDITELPLFDVLDTSSHDTFTQEINILGSSDRLDWVLGAFYLRDEWDRHTLFHNALPVFTFPVPSRFNFMLPKFDTDSLSWFLDATWEVTDRARLSAGVRRTEDEIDEYHRNEFLVLVPDPVIAFVACDQATQEEWGATTVRAVGQYDVHDTGNVYVSYSEGYKAGGVAYYECALPYSPETVGAYELGYKATFGGGRTTLSTAAFYYDYTDFQVVQVIGLSAVTRNAGDAEIRGLEVELSSILSEHWMVSGAVTLLDTEYGDFINLDGMHPELGFQNAKGNPLNKAPRTAINLGVAYSTPVQWGGRLTLRADAAFRSRTYFREFKDKADSQGAYTVVNLNASWESEDRGWEARLYARNATDEEYITFVLGSGTTGARLGSWGMPRQVGLEVTRRFGAR